MEDPTTDFGVALAEIKRLSSAAEFSPVAQGAFAVVQQGDRLESLEDFQEHPNRIRAAAAFIDAASFAAYVGRFATDGTVALADPAKGTITARIDYHEAPSVNGGLARPQHASHSATLNATFDTRYAAWREIDNRPLSQTALGEFMEERAGDVSSMAAADIMEMVLRFEAVRTLDFKSATRLADGTRQFRFEETDTQVGTVKVPEMLIVNLPIYAGGPATGLAAAVRHRIIDGKLFFVLKLLDRKLREEAAFREMAAQFLVMAACWETGAPVPPLYFGTSL